jgi:hypothetical protein
MFSYMSPQERFEELKKMLQAHELLRADLSPKQIEALANMATFEEHKQGTMIIEQNDPADHFYFIIRGQVRVVDVFQEPPQLLNYMFEGEIFGERGLLLNEPRSARVDVVVDVLVARFDQQAWRWLLGKVPNLSKQLRELEKEYEAHSSIPFAGRQADEVALIKTTRHILAFIITLPGPLSILLLGLLVGWLLTDLGLFLPGINYGISTVFGVFSLLWTIYNYIEWVNDDFIVSTKRVIHIERTIIAGEHREEAPLTQIHDVEVKTPNIFTRTFDYRTVSIKTAGLGTIVFDGIEKGEKIKEIVFEQAQKAKERMSAADVSSIRKSLAGHIGWETGPLEAKPLPAVELTGSDSKKAFELPRLIHYYIPIVREETPEGVTWRKHYWIWLHNIWLPGLVGLVVLYLFVASVFGLVPFQAFNSTTTTYLGVALAIVWFWYTYQHDDWHKDIYKVTGNKIIHQDSTAFRLRGEEIHETTLANVQEVNYTSPNFFSRILNLGHVVIKTATVGEAFVFENVYFPKDVQQELFNRWITFKDKEHQQRRAREEERFTTWLGEYHKMLSEKRP